MARHRNTRPRVHPPAASTEEQPLWKRLRIRAIALAGLLLTSFLTIVLFPAVENVLSDKAKKATSGPVMWASANSIEPEPGCLALKDSLQAQERAAIQLDSDVDTLLRRRGVAGVNHLSINLSLRGGTGQATVTAIDIRPRGKRQPPLFAALLCYGTAGTPPVPQLTADLDATPPIVKIKGKRYGERTAITVNAGEQIPAHLQVSITRGHLEFDIVVTYAHEDRASETLTVYDGDPKLKQPFRVTGAASDYRAIYVKGSGYEKATMREACKYLPRIQC